jgi:hypothetical protein
MSYARHAEMLIGFMIVVVVVVVVVVVLGVMSYLVLITCLTHQSSLITPNFA